MDDSRSIRSCSRARTNSSRGYALVSAIVVAVLYFALVELMLLDASRELAEARRFRARIVALTLAENGAELAAKDLAIPNHTRADVRHEDWQGTISGDMSKSAEGVPPIAGSANAPQVGVPFFIDAEGVAAGVTEVRARVHVRGRVVGKDVRIQYTIHSQ